MIDTKMARDATGLSMSGADAAAAEAYARGMGDFQRFAGDPVGAAEEAITAAPGCVMAHALKGWLYALATEPAATDVARSIHAVMRGLPATAREAAHVEALGHLVEGRWYEAGRRLAALSAEEPLDALALQAGHQIDFFTGNAAMLRDRIAAALPSWDEGMPGYHALLGMHAFGLEENGAYSQAEAEGRRAIALEPRDGWAQHAVAHVMEMQCRQREGIAWMREDPDRWSRGSFLQIHNWWHLALFHYELGEIDEVLALHDGPIYGTRSPLALNMVDASAILWRLSIGGHEVGGRWQALAENWRPFASAANYAFNDMHAMMAFVGAGDMEAARRLTDAQGAAIDAGGDNAAFTRDVGRPAAAAVLAFAEGDYRRVVALLAPLRGIAHRFGGSHAQRDVLELTLIEAALRAGDRELATRLADERHAARPSSPLSVHFRNRAKGNLATG
jgi:hypothetical protein